jgi:hypothetical protein
MSQNQQCDKFLEELATFGRTCFLKGLKLYPEATYGRKRLVPYSGQTI